MKYLIAILEREVEALKKQLHPLELGDRQIAFRDPSTDEGWVEMTSVEIKRLREEILMCEIALEEINSRMNDHV